ncbi:hypothetical protein IMSHALPRED_010858 [Imshaugia aleurites]|uniref:F-box domain-containing protein n=1 Tax=Imshaugia aleurites TaxID=172621 RepID=A0A8H3J025_9LECA|nr:hypothetical protein IMSHALPRED_010858 [Imshaugia aleurites]
MYCPPEILSAIMWYLPKVELKKARLVCKAFDAAAVPFLFDEIFIIPRYANIEKATLLASRFGPFVKTLIYCSEDFDGGIGRAVFKCITADTDLAADYYASFCKLQEEKKELLSGGEFFGHLCCVLIAIYNLQTIILTDECRTTQGFCWCQQGYSDAHSRTFNPRPDEDYPALKSLKSAPGHKCIKSFYLGLHHPMKNTWPDLLRALFTSGNTKVKTILTVESYSSSCLDISNFCMTPRQRFCATQILPNLTSLDLHLCVHDDDSESLFWEGIVAPTLSAAINLELLRIGLVNNDVVWDKEDYFNLIVGGCKMPKLVTFGLSYFTFTEEGMTNFLRNSQRIRHMSLEYAGLRSGSWENLFQTVKNTMSLESFKSRRFYGAGLDGMGYRSDPAIQRFLFGDGPNPFSRAALKDTAAE